MQKSDIGPYALVSGSWVLYTLLELFAPAVLTPNYRLPRGALNLIRLSILLPLLVFWSMAIYGARTFKKYADMVAGSAEERPLRAISVALYLSLAYFIIGALFGALLNFYTHSVGYSGLVIIKDHLPVAITIAAFWFFFVGSSSLCKAAGLSLIGRRFAFTTAVTLVLLVLFCIRFANMRITPAAALGNSFSYLSPAMLIVTLVIPYFVAWYLGALSVGNIVVYARKVHGVLYRKALVDLAIGLCLVIAFSALGGILDLVADTVAGLSLGPVLLILYLALLLYGAGYVFVARGARKMARIETVGT